MSHARELDVGRCDSRYDARHLRRKRRKSDAYHLRPLLEPLEQRRLLTSVTGQDPPPNSHDAPVTTDISAGFDADINPATVSAQTFAVHGMQTGQLLDPPHAIDVTGETITLSPADPFQPGELVLVTATAGIESLAGNAAAAYAWQFRTATSGGDALFVDGGQALGVSDSGDVALGDLDGDGDLDAFVGNDAAPNTVWLNDGSGAFTDTGQTLGNSVSEAVALGDLDGDGDLDAFVANGDYSSSRPNKVWLNDGSGNFSDSGQNLGNLESRAVALGDLDGDGDLDVFVGNEGSNKVWLNDGSGTFTNSGQNLGGGSETTSVALGDLDGDGDLDAFAGNHRDQPSRVWINDGSGTFPDIGQSLGNLNAVALGDLDSDGDLDAFVGNEGPNKVLLNDGSGNFSHSGQSLGNSGSEAVALGDLDGDGDLDAFVGNGWGYYGFPDPNKVWLNDGSGTFTDSGQHLGSSSSQAVALGDLDEDGDLDGFLANSNRQNDRVWINAAADEVVDLGISISDGQVDAVAGDTLAYTITVTNAGPLDVPGAVVIDRFPPLLIDVHWSCAASPGSSCPLGGGTGDIEETINIASGGSVIFTASATVDPAASLTGSVFANTATVNGTIGLLDRFLENNTAVDTNRLVGAGEELGGSEGFAYSPPIFLATGGEPVWCDTGDIDGDDHMDVLIVDQQQRSVLVSLGDGSGSFEPIGTDDRFAAGLQAEQMTTGDLDGDGDLDVVVVGGSAAILLNEGRQDDTWLGLASPVLYSVGNSATSAVVEDLDDDGHLDLVVAASDAIWVRLGRGDGTFEDGIRYTSGQSHRTVVVGDVDADGDLDLVVGEEESNDITVLLGDGGGTFEEHGLPLSLEQAPWILASGDVDADGDLDLAIAHNYSYDNNVSVLLGQGDGTFEPHPQAHTIPGNPSSLSIGDIDTDGDLDLVVGHSGGLHHNTYDNFGGGTTVLLGDGSGAFGLPIHVNTQGDGRSVSSGDLDGDGNLDLVVDGYEGVSILLARRDALFARTIDRYNVGEYPHSIAAGDLNGDGHADLAVSSDELQVLFSNGDGSFSDAVRYSVSGDPGALLIDDLNGDGHLDLVLTRESFNRLTVLIGSGDGAFGQQVEYTVGSRPGAVATHDLNGDGHLDLVTANRHSDDVSILIGNGDGTFAPHMRFTAGDYPHAVVAADVNEDGQLDLVTGNSILMGQGDGTFAAPLPLLVGGFSLVGGDVNGDGHIDFLAENENNVRVVLGRGDGTLEPGVQYPVAGCASSLALADLDSDGHLDVAAASLPHNWGGVSVLRGRGDGTFHMATVQYYPRRGFHSLTTHDLNGDEVLDLALIGPDGLAVLLNAAPSQSLSPGDFDVDRDVDGADFLVWQAGFGIQAGAELSDGDADLDGDVDGDDFLIWQSNFGTGVAAEAQGSGSVTPNDPARVKSLADGRDTRRSLRQRHVAAVDQSLSDYATWQTKLKASIVTDNLLFELAVNRAQ